MSCVRPTLRALRRPPPFRRTVPALAFLGVLMAVPGAGAGPADDPPRHVLVARESGKFLGWPANHGPMHAWGDELLVAFTAADHLAKTPDRHTVDDTKAQHVWLARSRDGGESWTVEKPEALRGHHDRAAAPVVPATGGIESDNPDCIVICGYEDKATGRSWFQVSPDRGHSWGPRQALPDFGLAGVQGRTDYVLSGRNDALFLFVAPSAWKPDEGRVFAARTRDGGITWSREGWTGPDYIDGYSIQPATVRLDALRLVTATRWQRLTGSGIQIHASSDDGRTWQTLTNAADTGGRSSAHDLTLLGDGRLVLTYAQRERGEICAKLSSDDGRTWGPEIKLRAKAGNWDLGYPRTARRRDGKLVSVYYWNDDPKAERCIAATVWAAPDHPAAPAAAVSRDALFEDYNQWKEARGGAPIDGGISAPPGFSVELMRRAGPEEGSWVSMVFDPRGRLLIGREDRGLLRLTPATDGSPERAESLAGELLECRGLLFAGGALYANANNSKGLYRLRDADGDDQFEEIRLIRQTPGGVGHGRNDLAEGPDGFLYSIHGDDVGLPPETSLTSPFRGPILNGLLPCAWEQHLYGGAAPAPQGQLVRASPDGSTWEVLAGGLRNPYGIAFNEDGEAFTYDADLEWDIGLPWYHPTRVLHLVPGADYGWRRSVSNPAPWLPDSRPAAADIGKGSPTAVCFGTKSAFPPAWRRALFILDWAYGRIWAVHLTPSGASYSGRSEIFLRGRPLNVTDLVFGPDGAMWFTTGGRKTRSALYRVRYTGPPQPEAPPPPEMVASVRRGAELRALRRRLEALAGSEDPNALDFAWPHLSHEDDWIRHAARLVVERRPPAAWTERAFAETSPRGRVFAFLALARTGPPELRDRLLDALTQISLTKIPVEEKLAVLRACEVAFLRWGTADPPRMTALGAALSPAFPDGDARVSRQLCELLVYLRAPDTVPKTMALLATAPTQEERLHYLFLLRLADSGWSSELRRTYFRELRQAAGLTGTHHLPLVLKYIHADAMKTLTDAERAALGGALAPPEPAPVPVAPPAPNRRLVKSWTVSDLDADLEGVTAQRDLNRGRSVYAEALCQHCHQFAGTGAPNGPDLTGVAGRFPRRDLLEHILDPSKVIAESYRNVSLTTKAGVIIDGRFIAEDEQQLTLAPNPVDPDRRQSVRKSDIASRRDSSVSPMPPALLDHFTRDEILDLLAWLEFGADEAPPPTGK